MTIQPIVLVLCTLVEFLLLSNFTTSFDNSASFDENPLIYTYNRLSEIQKECASFLSSASELKLDDSRGYMLEQKLLFYNGEWEQESGDFSPLIPYEDTDMSLESMFPVAPLKLVSFEVKHVSTVHQSKKAISFQGLMRIGQARNSSLIYDAYYNFHMSSGMSVLKIFFEGVYLENAGESMVCMLGNTTLPFLIGDTDPSGRIRKVSSLSNHEPNLFQDDHILLVLRYPKTFNLTRRSIQGEMRSLNDERSFKYFDPVHISSQLSRLSKYKFNSGEVKSRTCDPYPYQDNMVEDGANVFDGSEFCRNLKAFSYDGFNIVPNWKYIGKRGFRNRIGPFLIEGRHRDLDWSYDNVRMIMQNLLCERDDTEEIEPKNARVAAVFRVFPSAMDPSTADTRNSLSAMTLSAEGTWDSSTGQLCMVGCLGIADSGLDGCSSQISIYFPRSFSIKQRSVIVGSISSTVNEEDPYVPILFVGVSIQPLRFSFNQPRYIMSFLSYNYSKTELACAFRERNQPNKLIATIKKSLLTYPALQDAEQKQLAQLDSLAHNLYVGGFSVPYPPQFSRKPEIFVTIEVSSLGPLLGGYTEWLYNEKFPVSAQLEVPRSAVLNVSLSLMFTEAALKSEKSYKNISGLFLEGLYDPLLGEMYLIGCRNVKVESTNTEMERGMDCSIEVNILYPSATFRWLKNPSAKITIASKRNKDDPLCFTTVKLQTFMTRNREEDEVFRKVVDEILRNLLLFVANMIILHQLVHIKNNVNAAPYISLTMLVFQAIGYILPLISHSNILFEPKDFTTKLYNLYGNERLLQVLDYSSKILSLTCLILTALVSQKVSESRKSPSKLKRVTREGKVVFIILTMLIIGFVILLLVRGNLNAYTSVTAELKEFVAFVQNFFLLPQIIGNLLWQIRVKSLTEVYYFGFTLLRVLALVYGYIRDPIIDPYSMKAVEFMSLGSSSASRIGHVVALVAMILLAARVHVQQNLSQQKLCTS